MSDTWGIFLTRAQPFHNGHLSVIKKMLEENDKVLVIIGSANKEGTLRNPFDVKFRERYVNDVLNRNLYADVLRVKVVTLNDWSMETYTKAVKEWGKFFYYNIVNWVGVKTFSYYFSEDITYVQNWFTEDIIDRISFVACNRKDYADNISATQLRGYILQDNYTLANTYCNCTHAEFQYMKKVLLNISKEPREDYMI